MSDPFDFNRITRQSKNLAVKLTARGEQRVRSGHPWIFEHHIEQLKADGQTGDIAIIFSHKKNQVLGIGLYDPDSPICIKMLHHGSGKTIDTTFFEGRVEVAYKKRIPLLQTDTNSYRLLFGENDGFPGLIADVYAEVLVIKLYSTIWLPWFKALLDKLLSLSGAGVAVLRLSRKLIQSPPDGLRDGMVIFGSLDGEDVVFKEHGVRFSANVIQGHKTGYFLDHRHNRKRVGELSQGKSVLDVFAYSGGFSVHALVGGATEVTSVDISRQALDQASNNVWLNEFNGSHICLAGDAFKIMKELAEQGKTYDMVVIDPPSFAKQQSEIDRAKHKYANLTEIGSRLTSSNGLLVLASCSSRISKQSFFDVVETTLRRVGRRFKCLEKSDHDIDHPVSFPEGAYLKCGFYRFID
ncbi:MAG: methyltransferase domain-containing protein [Flavobacteriaceae bacterium]|nr:methyltransferase domain-containing protein [Flavobacteriaceae bacterium]